MPICIGLRPVTSLLQRRNSMLRAGQRRKLNRKRTSSFPVQHCSHQQERFEAIDFLPSLVALCIDWWSELRWTVSIVTSKFIVDCFTGDIIDETTSKTNRNKFVYKWSNVEEFEKENWPEISKIFWSETNIFNSLLETLNERRFIHSEGIFSYEIVHGNCARIKSLTLDKSLL